MVVGKPDFNLNSFGVKYLSKDEVQNFLEIKKFGKNIGDTPDPVKEKRDKDGNIIQVKPHPQKPEVFTDIKGNNAHQNPKAIKRGGFKGRSMRRVDPKTGDQIKVGQTEEETTPPEGQVPTSRKNDVQYGKLGQESASEVRESFDMITDNDAYKEEINRDAPLTEKEGTEKFDDNPATNAIRDRIAARKKKKEDAAKKKLKKANDIIMDMNIMKLDLMKDGIQGGGKNVPIPKKDGDEDDTWKQNSRQQGLGATDVIWAGYPFAPPETRPGGRYPEKPDMKGAPKDLKRKAEEIILKVKSLKLDLMKDGIEGGGKNIPSGKKVPWIDNYGQQHKEGQAETARNQYDKVGLIYGDAKGKRPVKGVNNKPDSRIDPEDYTYDEKTEVGSTGDASSYPADPAEKRYPAAASGANADYMQHWDKHMGEQRRRGTEHNTHQEPSKLDSKDRGTTLPKGLKEKAEETIYKAISLKLDLMKDTKDGKQSKDGLPIRNGELEDLVNDDSTREFSANMTNLGNESRDIKEAFQKKYGFKMSPKNLKHFGRRNRMSGGTKESLKSQAEETILKAISLKLDLMNKKSKFKPSNPLHQNIHPNNIGLQNDPYYKNVDLSVDYNQMSRDGDREFDAVRREKIRTDERAKVEEENNYDHYGKDL